MRTALISPPITEALVRFLDISSALTILLSKEAALTAAESIRIDALFDDWRRVGTLLPLEDYSVDSFETHADYHRHNWRKSPLVAHHAVKKMMKRMARIVTRSCTTPPRPSTVCAGAMQRGRTEGNTTCEHGQGSTVCGCPSDRSNLQKHHPGKWICSYRQLQCLMRSQKYCLERTGKEELYRNKRTGRRISLPRPHGGSGRVVPPKTAKNIVKRVAKDLGKRILLDRGRFIVRG